MTADKILKKLESMRNERNIEGMNRFGIRGANMLGISVYGIKRIAKDALRELRGEKTQERLRRKK